MSYAEQRPALAPRACATGRNSTLTLERWRDTPACRVLEKIARTRAANRAMCQRCRSNIRSVAGKHFVARRRALNLNSAKCY